MTAPKHLLPLRVPELGPSLGKLITGTRKVIPGLSLDGERQRMVTKVIESAGEARRLAAREERAAALAALDRPIWLAAWEEAVGAVAHLVIQRANQGIASAAHVVRMPRRKTEEVQLDSGEQRALSARLGSAGAGLVAALDDLAERTTMVLPATSLERSALEAWQDALRTCARRLEASWMTLEEAVERESVYWEGVAAEVSQWRKPLWPVWVTGAVALPLSVWFGLILSGYATPPGWLERIWSLFPW